MFKYSYKILNTCIRYGPLFCLLASIQIPFASLAAEPKWTSWVIDGNAKLGHYNSFGFDYQDRPIIVHYEYDGQRLVDNIYDHGTWYRRTIDTNAASDVPSPSVAFGDKGGGVSYITKIPSGPSDRPKYSLKFSLFDGLKWKPPSTVHADDVPSHQPFSSLAIDSKGRPGIAFVGDDKLEARFALLDQAKWQYKVAHKRLRYHFSLAFDKNDHPAIAIADIKPPGYSHFDGRSWKFHKLPSAAWRISLKFDHKNRATLVYHEVEAKKLRYAIHDGKEWIVSTVTEGQHVGLFISHGFDSDNRPGIAYFDNRDNSLHYAFYDGMVWQTEKVDDELGKPTLDIGTPITLDFDSNDNPGISYVDYTNNQLKFALKEIKRRKYQSEICNNAKDDDGDGQVDGNDPSCQNGLRITASLKELQAKRYQPGFLVTDQYGNPVKGIRFKIGGIACAGLTNSEGKLTCNIVRIMPEQGLPWQALAQQGIIRESTLKQQRVNLSGVFKGISDRVSFHTESDRYQIDPATTSHMFLADDFYLWQADDNNATQKSGHFVVEGGKAKAVRLTFPATFETTKFVTRPGWVGVIEETDQKYKIGVVIDVDAHQTEDIHRLLNGKNYGIVMIDESDVAPKYMDDHQKILDVYRIWKIKYQYNSRVTPSKLLQRKEYIKKAMASFLVNYNKGKIINEHYWNLYCKIYLCASDVKKNQEMAKAVVSTTAWEAGQSAFVNGASAAAIKSSSGLIFKEALKMHAKEFADGIYRVKRLFADEAHKGKIDPVSLVVNLGAIAIGYGFKMGNFGTWRDAMKDHANLALTLTKEVRPLPKYIESIKTPGYGDVYLAMLEAARRHYKFAHKLYSFYKEHPAEKIPLFISPNTDQLINTAQNNIDKVESWIKDYQDAYLEGPAIDTAYGITWAKLIQDQLDRSKRSHLAWSKPGLRKESPAAWNKLKYKRYRSSGKKSADYSAVAGGKDTQGCNTSHGGVLPQNFPASTIQVVTFPLLDSLEHRVRSIGYQEASRHGSTALKLKIGDREVTALSVKMPPGITGTEGPAWYVTFEFEPALRVSPGDKWHLLDGDNDADTVVVLHSNDKDHTGLLGFSETSGCPKAFSRRTGYSAWFGMRK